MYVLGIYVCIYVRTYVCIYVYVCVCVFMYYVYMYVCAFFRHYSIFFRVPLNALFRTPRGYTYPTLGIIGCVDTAQAAPKWLHLCVRLPGTVLLFRVMLFL